MLLTHRRAFYVITINQFIKNASIFKPNRIVQVKNYDLQLICKQFIHYLRNFSLFSDWVRRHCGYELIETHTLTNVWHMVRIVCVCGALLYMRVCTCGMQMCYSISAHDNIFIYNFWKNRMAVYLFDNKCAYIIDFHFECHF